MKKLLCLAALTLALLLLPVCASAMGTPTIGDVRVASPSGNFLFGLEEPITLTAETGSAAPQNYEYRYTWTIGMKGSPAMYEGTRNTPDLAMTFTNACDCGEYGGIVKVALHALPDGEEVTAVTKTFTFTVVTEKPKITAVKLVALSGTRVIQDDPVKLRADVTSNIASFSEYILWFTYSFPKYSFSSDQDTVYFYGGFTHKPGTYTVTCTVAIRDVATETILPGTEVTRTIVITILDPESEPEPPAPIPSDTFGYVPSPGAPGFGKDAAPEADANPNTGAFSFACPHLGRERAM